jgi:hypothetical protein
MSANPFGENPYSPPGPALYAGKPAIAPWVEQPSGPWQMNYFGAFDMIHRNPDWFVNTLLMFVCAIIPVIGGIVLNGYVYETIEILHRTSGLYYPKFDFNRFVEYLLRGVGPFLIGLVLNTILAFVVIFSYLAVIASAVAAGAAADKPDEAAVGMGVLGAVAVVVPLVFAVSLVIGFFTIPLGLRGGLSSDIGQSFNFGWAIEFIKKTWLEMILVFLFQIGLGIVLELIILATCGIGLLALPVMVGYIVLITAWLQFQLYRVFLSRGGEPVPFKPAPLPLPM